MVPQLATALKVVRLGYLYGTKLSLGTSEKELQSLEQHHHPNHEKIEEVRKALNCWLDAENTMWHQRSRHLWIINGDQNTSFFHQKASNHKDTNLIQGITDTNGVWQKDA